jgi:hypothetical protein
VAASEIAQAKSYLASNDPGITKIDITEIVDSGSTYIPGTTVQYLAAMERGQIDAAAHSCWNNDCFDNSLDSLIGTNGTTISADWFAYQAYANITGTIVGVTPSATVDGIAGQDSGLHQAYAVFGRDGGSTDVTFTFTNISSAAYLYPNGEVHAMVYTLANDNGSGSSGPTLLTQEDVAVLANSISVSVPAMGTNDVAIIQLTSGPGAPAPPVITGVTAH